MSEDRDARCISIVVPTYNSADWLPSTLNHVESALLGTAKVGEVVIVDDGSSDDTVHVVERIAQDFPITLKIISQENRGVFAARRRGAREARYSTILFLDSRVLIAPDAIRYLEGVLLTGDGQDLRVGHVATATTTPLVGRFWDVPTHVFWGRYLRNPMLTRITKENFDSVPKGTGFLLADKAAFLEACDFVGDGSDRFVSDDTKLLRYMVEKEPGFLDPDFRATYQPRTSVRRFLSHGFLRGTLFVDSYYDTTMLRRVALWIMVVAPPVAVTFLAFTIGRGNGLLALIPLIAFLAVVLGLVGASALNRVSLRAIFSFLVYVLPFAVVFWAGIFRGMVVRNWKRSD